MKKIEELYKQYIRDIYRYLVSMNHNGSLSEDLLSETYINAMNSIGNFKKESEIKTWLFSIARYTWFGYYIMKSLRNMVFQKDQQG